MKLHIGSDLHLEFGVENLEVPGGADVLILAGDICTPHRHKPEFNKFFDECADKYPRIFYVLGNHEHYWGDIEKTVPKLRQWISSNGWPIHVLDNTVVKLEDNLQIYGSTLWTDLKSSDPIVMWDAQRNMNDYNCIFAKGRKLKPQTTIYKNSVALRGLKKALLSGISTIVVTHHGPSYQSIPDRFKSDILSFAYVNNLDELIEQNPDIITWVHGHTHNYFQYSIGDCSVACNPKGYPGERNKEKYEFLTMEVNV